MKETITIAALLLDASGSMKNLQNSVISGVNEYLDKLKQDYEDHPENGKILCTLATFRGDRSNPNINMLHNLVDIREIEPITKKDYQPRGGTPLFDAIQATVDGIDQFLVGKIDLTGKKPSNALVSFLKKNTGKDKPDYKIIVVVQTDGEENASSKVTSKEALKTIITEHETMGNWTFVFLGADLDAMQEGMSLGMAAGNTYNYRNDSASVIRTYAGTTKGISAIRGSSMLRSDNFSSFMPPEDTVGEDKTFSGKVKIPDYIKDWMSKRNVKPKK